MKEGEVPQIIIIGGGPGGYPAAIKASQLGANVILVDKGGIGGTCLHRGCIPTKLLLKMTREYQHLVQLGKNLDINLPAQPEWINLMRHKTEIVQHLFKGTVSLINKNRIRVISGTASFINPRTVQILETGEILQASAFIIATGSKAIRPPIEGIELPGVIDSDEILTLQSIPQSIVIIGGGAVGLEFAQIFKQLGAKVSIIEMLERVLPNEEEEISAAMQSFLTSSGIVLYTGSQVNCISQVDGNFQISFMKDRKVNYFEAEKVLVAVGRKPYFEQLGIQTIGLRFNGQAIMVNEKLETNVHGVYAVGDVVGGPMLAHKATAEGECAAQNAVGMMLEMAYFAVPRVVYTHPEVASVGLLEQEAREKYGDLLIGRFPFRMNPRALLEGSYTGFIKIIASKETECILGVSIMGPQAGHLIGEAALAIQMEATIEDMGETIHAHPTLSEAIREAILDTKGKSIHLPT